MQRLFSVIITIVVIISFIFVIKQPTIPNIVNAQTVENEIIENTLEKTTAGVTEISKAMKNASELITNSIETKGDHGKSSATLKEHLKLAQEKLAKVELAQEKLKQLELESSVSSNNNLNIDIGLPPIDFSKILRESNSLIEVEYQSAYSVILRGNEETLLLVNGTLAPFWYAIDIVKKHGYQLKEITESGMGTQGNPTRFYAVMEK
jgi:hypothetical protein